VKKDPNLSTNTGCIHWNWMDVKSDDQHCTPKPKPRFPFPRTVPRCNVTGCKVSEREREREVTLVLLSLLPRDAERERERGAQRERERCALTAPT